ncbi:MAG: hypothetical protein ACI4AH_06745 [Muribaculaceae bacterium]
MKKRARQSVSLVLAIIIYFLVHEGAHALVALHYGVLKRVNFMLLGIQVDVFHEQMTSMQMGLFCLVGAVVTFVIGWMLVLWRERICGAKSAFLRALTWYVTLVLLVLDPLYLSVLYRFVGGGDMNGIALIIPKVWASIGFALLLVVNIATIARWVYPSYKRSFANVE